MQWSKTTLVALATFSMLVATSRANDANMPGLYKMKIETGMPNLENNLRYAMRNEERCLSKKQLSSAFWILNHVSLQDCTLVPSRESAELAVYHLQCSGGYGTTGEAHWIFDNSRVSGTLHVRLGGKNMTFYQRVTATHIGDCPG